MISQKDLDAINGWFWGDNPYPELESAEICWHCQGNGYIRHSNEYLEYCNVCSGIGLI